MKKVNTLRKLSGIVLGLCLAIAGMAQTYSSSPNAFISSTNPSGITDDIISVPLTGTIGVDYFITDVTININHTWDGDLEIQLVGPGGTPANEDQSISAGQNRIYLVENEGGSANNFTNTQFNDNAASCIGNSGSAPYTGEFRPEGSNSESCNISFNI